MPHLRFRAVSAEDLQKISRDLVPEISKALNTPENHFTCELVPTQYFQAGKNSEGEPFCEILWFDRGPDARSQVARKITEFVQKLRAGKDVVVLFTSLPKDHYFENGEHF